MSDTIPKLPGLTGKTEAQLRDLYTELIGEAIPEGLDTVAKLTHGLKEAFAAKHPEAAKAATPHVAAEATPVGAQGVTKVDARTGLEHALPQATWDLLSQAEQKHFTMVGEKPASLAKA